MAYCTKPTRQNGQELNMQASSLLVGEMNKTVTLEQVEKALEECMEAYGEYHYHQVDLGQAGYVDIDCEYSGANFDVSDVLNILVKEAKDEYRL